MSAISIVICDDQRMFCSALARTLDDAAHRVHAVLGNGDRVIAVVQNTQPDVCVMDVSARENEESGLFGAVKAVCPGARVLVLTHRDGADLRRAFDDGLVDAVVSKTHGLDTVRTAIDRVALGERFTLSELHSAVPPRAAPMSLTDREREILWLLARGATTRQIMDALAISRNTVRSHIQHLLDKLHAHTRAQAVQIALTTHLLLDVEAALS